jgi:hypothetical protein
MNMHEKGNEVSDRDEKGKLETTEFQQSKLRIEEKNQKLFMIAASMR